MNSLTMPVPDLQPMHPFVHASAPSMDAMEPSPLSGVLPEPEHTPGTSRPRLADLDMHLHCSIVGTCLTDSELRKVISKFVHVDEFSELDVHHEAVRLASQHPQASRALQKSLDRRFEPTLRRFAKVSGARELEALWQDFSRRGEVPGAYWALLSHRHATDDMRQRVFGEVHMLSHLMGTSTRTDLRQRVFLQAENEQLKQQWGRLQDRYQRLVETHERAEQEQQQSSALLQAARAEIVALRSRSPADAEASPLDRASDAVAWHTQRREQAEQDAARTGQENLALQEHVTHLRTKLQEVLEELHSADAELRKHYAEHAEGEQPSKTLSGQRLLYVGGRPSSTHAIQEWVERQGGELRCHDGGLEDRKGQLVAAIAWADRVLFPVDCIDHDSAGNIKRQCTRLGIPFSPLRSASLSSFVQAALATKNTRPPNASGHLCLRHA